MQKTITVARQFKIRKALTMEQKKYCAVIKTAKPIPQ